MVRLRHHVNPLRSQYQIGRAPRLPLPAAGEVEVEVGCADARFLFQRAAALPSVTCIGLEIREDLVHEVNRRAAEQGVANLRAVFANANCDLDTLFPDGRLDRAFINFPDPWWKTRHHKRRLMSEELASVLARKLRPGGVLLFQSDVFDLALDALAVLEGEPALANARGPWSFLRDDHGFSARSLREERCLDRGMPIWRMLYTSAR